MFIEHFRAKCTFTKINWHNPKPWSTSFSGYRIFPDLSLGMHEDAYHISIWDKSHRNLASWSRDITIFVKIFIKYPHANLTLDLHRWSVIKYCYSRQNLILCLYLPYRMHHWSVRPRPDRENVVLRPHAPIAWVKLPARPPERIFIENRQAKCTCFYKKLT